MLARLILVIVVLLWGVGIRIGKGPLLTLLDSMPPSCPVRIWLGLKCAFCGMTHAFLHLFFLDFRGAHFENPLSVPLFLISIMALLFSAIQPEKSKAIFPQILRSLNRVPVVLFMVISLTVFAILRNIL